MCHTRLRNADLGESVHSIGPKKMADSFDDMIISVWRQTLIENEKIVELADKRYFVKRTSRHRFRQVDFTFEGQEFRGLEPNPGGFIRP